MVSGSSAHGSPVTLKGFFGLEISSDAARHAPSARIGAEHSATLTAESSFSIGDFDAHDERSRQIASSPETMEHYSDDQVTSYSTHFFLLLFETGSVLFVRVRVCVCACVGILCQFVHPHRSSPICRMLASETPPYTVTYTLTCMPMLGFS
jgi:hypothetical protein